MRPHTVHLSRLCTLPVELRITIFVLAQNPQFPLVSRTYWHLSKSPLVRAKYLVHRFGKAAALGSRSMACKIVTLDVIDNLLKLHCDPKADDDWLSWNACERDDCPLGSIILRAIKDTKGSLGHFLNIAAIKGAIGLIDLLVNTFSVDINQPDGACLALALACAENQVATVRHLMTRYGCDVHWHRERHLRRACLQGFAELVELLLPGADVHAFNDAALQNAAHRGHWMIVNQLLQAGADPQANRNGPIQSAIFNGDARSLRYLLDAGADPSWNQSWPLRLACQRESLAVVEMLLQDTRVDPNAGRGMPLRESLKAQKTEVVQALLDHGADPNSVGAVRGLRSVVRQNNSSLLMLMAKAGARLDHPSILACEANNDMRNILTVWCQQHTS
ncbi:hypothetical protein DFQ28_003684 [Apophysomyces sp. BC1034]|nr:hypothetical protein DFQ30_003665 [Apophysomyces sp. BC1015]KAG0178941.1 hypothetical protein DFQ29_002792 [Apophysomyces sp. BC1021]KAG0189247.1 hypothetical protein DFQ28_003684 [Apophysomyces sp. BC1034]